LPYVIFLYAEPKFPGSGFGSGLVRLASALNTDLDWLREHTRYLQRATEWDVGGRPANRLLSGPDIASAKAWAARRPKNAPEPTESQLDFIKASEVEESRRQGAEAQRLQEMADAQAARAAALAEREKAQEREAEARKSEADAQKREAEQAKRAVRRTRLGLAAAVLLALAAGSFAVYAFNERDQAQVQRDLAEKATGKAEEQRKVANNQRDLAEKATAAANEQRDRALQRYSRAPGVCRSAPRSRHPTPARSCRLMLSPPICRRD
jgi:hypothetical protein